MRSPNYITLFSLLCLFVLRWANNYTGRAAGLSRRTCQQWGDQAEGIIFGELMSHSDTAPIRCRELCKGLFVNLLAVSRAAGGTPLRVVSLACK